MTHPATRKYVVAPDGTRINCGTTDTFTLAVIIKRNGRWELKYRSRSEGRAVGVAMAWRDTGRDAQVVTIMRDER
jgi:hypothetical protein